MLTAGSRRAEDQEEDEDEPAAKNDTEAKAKTEDTSGPQPQGSEESSVDASSTSEAVAEESLVHPTTLDDGTTSPRHSSIRLAEGQIENEAELSATDDTALEAKSQTEDTTVPQPH